MDALAAESPAKINLTLRVGDVRPDGFHEIESLVARISLCDTVDVQARGDERLTLACDEPSIPCDAQNLALRAAQRLADAAAEFDQGADIFLAKRIPAGAGLGGGSSNAATTLRLLNRLWNLGLSRAELADIGAEIGSDVPLFLHGSPCALRGRGERIESVDFRLEGWVVLALPDIHSATGEVYAARDRLTSHPHRRSLDELLASLRNSRRRRYNPADGIATVPAASVQHFFFNDLEAAALAANAGLAHFAQQLRQAAPETLFHMSGSGSAYFALPDTEAAARDLANALAKRLRARTEVATIVSE